MKNLAGTANRVNSFEQKISGLSDAQLREKDRGIQSSYSKESLYRFNAEIGNSKKRFLRWLSGRKGEN